MQKEYDALGEELEDLFKDRKQFKSRHDLFERMVKKIEKRQKELLDDLKDTSAGDKALLLVQATLTRCMQSRGKAIRRTKVEQKTLPHRLHTFERLFRR